MVPLDRTGHAQDIPGVGVSALQPLRAEISQNHFPVEATGRQRAVILPRSSGGNGHYSSGRQRGELSQGVPQLYFLTRMWGNVLYLNCSLVEQCSSKRGWKTVKQMCTEKSQLCNVFPWPERPQCVILGLGWVTQCGWAQTLCACSWASNGL